MERIKTTDFTLKENILIEYEWEYVDEEDSKVDDVDCVFNIDPNSIEELHEHSCSTTS